MGSKLGPKIIPEGTRLTLKTENTFAHNEHPRDVGPRRNRYHSPLVSAEWFAFTNVPRGRGLINFSAEEEARALETYATWARLFVLLRCYSWIVDRLHVSTPAHQLLWRGARYDVGTLGERLLPLGSGLAPCTRRSETFASAQESRLVVSGKPDQYDDLERFVRDQQVFGQLVAASRLPSLSVEVWDGDVAGAAAAIADWPDATGGLTMAGQGQRAAVS